MRKTQTSTMLQNRQEFLSERERSSNPFNLQRLSLNQTADLAGGGSLRLICRATNEWQILRRAAPHARPDTCCWPIDCFRKLNQTADLAGGGPLRLIVRATNEWQILRSAAPHARTDTRRWFLGISDNISESTTKT